MIFSLSPQSILRVIFLLILLVYLVGTHLLSMYRRIKQAKLMIITRLNELKSVADDEIVRKMVDDLLTREIAYYQSLLTSILGTVLRKLHLVKADDASLIQMVHEIDSVHTR